MHPPITHSRVVSVCDYVALSFDEVTSRLGATATQDELTASLNTALGAKGPRLLIRAEPLEPLGRAVARLRATCQADAPGAEAYEGTITILEVSSGRQPLTELLVSARVDDEVAQHAALVARRFLELVTAVLGRPA